MFYQFHCKDCDKNIELNIPVDKLSVAKCNNCNSINLERIWSATPSLFKCEGAYSKRNHRE